MAIGLLLGREDEWTPGRFRERPIGLFLVWKGTADIHHRLEGVAEEPTGPERHPSLTSTVAQIVALDVVFSLGSVFTAVGMASNLVIMMAPVIIACC